MRVELNQSIAVVAVAVAVAVAVVVVVAVAGQIITIVMGPSLVVVAMKMFFENCGGLVGGYE